MNTTTAAKLVFVAGMPRAGSMWAYNIARDLMSGVYDQVLPGSARPDEMEVIGQALSQPLPDNQAWCIKAHSYIQPNTGPHSRFICNYRDVRDALYSFQRFMKCDFEHAMNHILGDMMLLTDQYMLGHQDQKRILFIRYPDVEHKSTTIIRRIGRLLGIPVSDTRAQAMADHYSREQVRKIIGNLEQQVGEVLYVRSLDGSYRLFDQSTSFQSEHVAPETDPGWRNFYNEEQIARLNAATLPWLQRYGFEKPS